MLRIFLVLAAALSISSQGWAVELRFASAAEGSRTLATEDEFTRRMSPFDRAARMQTDREVLVAEYLQFAGSVAQDWDASEKRRVESAFQAIAGSIEQLGLPLPAHVQLIKTSGDEEGGAAYTRQAAIILPVNLLTLPAEELQRLIAHELFHIATRANVELKTALYAAIGFHDCGAVPFPEALAARKITNPDAPANDHCIAVNHGDEKVWAIPILYSSSQRYDTERGGAFFDYLQFALLLVEAPNDAGRSRALMDADGPRLTDLQQVSGFFEQVGRNTQYIIHPEEILADNFALLVLERTDLPSPEVLTRLQDVLTSFSAGGSPRHEQ